MPTFDEMWKEVHRLNAIRQNLSNVDRFNKNNKNEAQINELTDKINALCEELELF